MSSGGRTRDDETLRPFRTDVGTLDGSWPTKTGGSVTFQSGFLGSTGMSDCSQASYRHWASCGRGGGYGLYGVCSTCPQPTGEG